MEVCSTPLSPARGTFSRQPRSKMRTSINVKAVTGILLSFVVVFTVFRSIRNTEDNILTSHANTARSQDEIKKDGRQEALKVNASGPFLKSGRSSKAGAFYTKTEMATHDEDWEHKKCRETELVNQTDFYQYVRTSTLHCDKPAMFGGSMLSPTMLDGEKWVCISKQFNIHSQKCIIYSFGISNDWSFDDDMDRKYKCKVFSFDPTINKEDHQRSPNIRFFNLGISHVTNKGENVTKKVDRYKNIVQMLGHESAIIDYLKMDVEGHEREFFDDVLYKTPNLLKNVKMIGMEIHISERTMGTDHKRFWKWFQRLDCLGFKIWYSDMNNLPSLQYKVNGEVRSACYEIVWAQDRQW